MSTLSIHDQAVRAWCAEQVRKAFAPLHEAVNMPTCSECNVPNVYARGMCNACYQKWYRVARRENGAPLFHARDLEADFWSRVDKSGSCWEWTAGINDAGYGIFRDSASRPVRAHRYAYELVVGPIPDGLVLDHLCRNRSCVNPKHLEPVTNAENLRRGEGFTGKRKRQTHCIHGHEFTPENTKIRSNGTRTCRECTRVRAAAKYWQDRS